MKSTKSKVLAAVLAASILMTACSSNTGKDVSGEDVTDSMSEEVTTETTEEVPEGDEIIPLYKAEYEEEIRKINPLDLLYFDHFSQYFPLTSAKEDEQGRKLYQLENGNSFDLTYDDFDLAVGYGLEGIDPKTTTTVEMYFISDFNLTIRAESDENSAKINNFVPLFYNQTKGCLVGYKITAGNNPAESEVKLSEVHHGYTEALSFGQDSTGAMIEIDPGEYGFTDLPTVDTPTIDEIITLVKPEFAGDIKNISPADMYEFDNYSKYFNVETFSDEDGFVIYHLESEGDIKLRDFYNDINTDNFTAYGVDYYAYGRSGELLGGMYINEEKSISDFGDLSGYYDFKKGNAFVPLLYNKTRGCLIGYVPEAALQMLTESGYETYNGSQYFLIELYYGSMMPFVDIMPATNVGRYGF